MSSSQEEVTRSWTTTNKKRWGKRITNNEKMQWEGWIVVHMKKQQREQTITNTKRWWERQIMQMKRGDKENEQ